MGAERDVAKIPTCSVFLCCNSIRSRALGSLSLSNILARLALLMLGLLCATATVRPFVIPSFVCGTPINMPLLIAIKAGRSAASKAMMAFFTLHLVDYVHPAFASHGENIIVFNAAKMNDEYGRTGVFILLLGIADLLQGLVIHVIVGKFFIHSFVEVLEFSSAFI